VLSARPAGGLRILIPINAVYVVGGIGTVVSGLLPALAAATQPGEEVVVGRPGGLVVRALPAIGRPSGALARLAFEQIALPRLAARCDSVHLCDTRAVLASRRPFVLTVHDVSFLDEPGWYAPWAASYKRLMLMAALAKRPAAVVCDSQHTRERLLAHHPAAGRFDVRVVHPGVAEPPADCPAREESQSDPYFLTVSTIEPRKNHLGLLRAFRAARSCGLRLRWKVVGGPGHRSATIRAALAAEDGVDLMGWVEPPVLEELYAGAQFLALASHSEGFAYPPLEAMARGVATFCSTGSGLDETVGTAGLRAPSSDTDAWTAGLLKLQDNCSERARLVAAGRDQVRHFAWRRAADSVLDIHRGITCDRVRLRCTLNSRTWR
jgi:glycosyltransferase involved in cell wall biosynthesis